MTMTGDMFEVYYYVVENHFFWLSKEKTIFTLNLCLAAIAALVPLWIIPIRYMVVVGLWGLVASHSPFFVSVGRSLLELGLEYGIMIERVFPKRMSRFQCDLETCYIPRIVAVWRWIPVFSWYIPCFMKEIYEKSKQQKTQDSKS